MLLAPCATQQSHGVMPSTLSTKEHHPKHQALHSLLHAT